MCVSEVAVPGRLLGAEPSPQSTLIEATVPSESVAVKVTVIRVPVSADDGDTFVTETVGGWFAVTVTGTV